MLLYILLIFLVFMLLMTIWYTKGDYMYPPVIVYSMFIITVSLAVYNSSIWQFKLSYHALFILLVGLFTYGIVGFIIRTFSYKHMNCKVNYKNKNCNDNEIGNREIKIEPIVTFFICLFGILVIYEYYLGVKNTSSLINGFSSWSEMIGNYRNATSSGKIAPQISPFALYGYQFITASAYIYLYVFIYNFIIFWKKNRKISILLYAVPILEYAIGSLLTGGRNPILQLFFATIVTVYIVNMQVSRKSIRYNFKFIRNTIVIATIMIILFSQFRWIVGRDDSSGMIDYISIYLGAPIRLFDLFINDLPIKSNIFGKETLYGINQIIGTIFNNYDLCNYVMNKEFRTVNGIGFGNVYTAFRAYYYDFGIGGVIFFAGLGSAIYCKYYLAVKKRISYQLISKKNEIPVFIIMFLYICNAPFYYSVDDRFFQAILSRSSIEIFIIMIILCKILPKVKFRYSKKKNKMKLCI